MKKTIELHKQNVEYAFRISRRAKRMSITVYGDGRCVVTAPKPLTEAAVEGFLVQKSKWLFDKINYFKSTPAAFGEKRTKKDYLEYKDQALSLANERVQYFNQVYGYAWNRITIKDQKTRWGSCSKKGNLNFNYKIALLPPEMADYIIVHELCHLGEFNHSQKFWNLVAKTIPHHRQIRSELRKRKM